MLLIIFFIFGLAIGSFLNACIYRVPRGMSVILPPSFCFGCTLPLSARDLVPVFSYLLLRGHCRYCRAKISPYYPLVELLTGFLFVSVYLLSSYSNIYYLGTGLFLVSYLLVAAGIDLKHYLIPNKIVLWGLGAGFISLMLPGGPQLLSALGGALLGSMILLLLALISRGGMGGGDIKLALVLGLFLGLPAILVGLFLAAFLAAIAGGSLILAGRMKRKDPLPFAPFLAAGTFAAYFFTEFFVGWYKSLFF